MKKSIKLLITVLAIQWLFSGMAIAESEEELDQEILKLEREFSGPYIKLNKVKKPKRAKRRVRKVVRAKKRKSPKKVVIAQHQPTQPKINYSTRKTEFKVSDSDNSLSYDNSYSSSKRKPWGLNVYTYFSSADSISSTNNTSANYSYSQLTYVSDYTGQYASGSSFGIGVEYSNKTMFRMASTGIGFSVGASYDFDRTVQRGYMGYQDNTYYGYDDPKVSVFLPYANVNMSFQNESYVYTGLNYSIPIVSSAPDEDFSGDLGFQVGFGTQITEYMAIEVTHRWVAFAVSPNYDGYYGYRSSNTSSTSREQRQGLGVLEKENLELNGFNLNFVATF